MIFTISNTFFSTVLPIKDINTVTPRLRIQPSEPHTNPQHPSQLICLFIHLFPIPHFHGFPSSTKFTPGHFHPVIWPSFHLGEIPPSSTPAFYQEDLCTFLLRYTNRDTVLDFMYTIQTGTQLFRISCPQWSDEQEGKTDRHQARARRRF